MASQKRRAGTITFKVDGAQLDAKGNFTYNLGYEKREALIGADRIHGYKATQQVPFIEGELTDSKSMSLKTLVNAENVTVTLELANGKTVVGAGMWYAGEGTGNTEEANIGIRFEGDTVLQEI